MPSSRRRYFRLNPESFLVLGPRRSVVHNLYTGEAVWCDEPTTEALVQGESNRPLEERSDLLARFAERGWGFFAERPVFVDKLRTFNVFRQKRLWKETPFVSLAVLQVTNQCRRACPTCTTAFCPICTSLPSNRVSLATDEWLGLIGDLARYGTQMLLLTGGEALLRDDLPELIEAGLARGMQVQVHTSGLVPVRVRIPEGVAFSILIDPDSPLPELIERFRDRQPVIALVDRSLDLATLGLPREWMVKRVGAGAPVITRQNLVTTPLDRFFARKTTDDCLNGKIYVAHDGRILPCFGRRGEVVADLRSQGLSESIRRLVGEWWGAGVEQRGRPCSGCEFRYCCNACRLVDAERGCTYDIKAGVWREEARDRS